MKASMQPMQPALTSIRLMTGQDGDHYRSLRLKALQTDPEAFLADYDSESARQESHFKWELDASHRLPIFGYYGYFLRDDNLEDKLVGFIQLGQSNLVKQSHIGFLYNLYVDPEFRNQGVAHQLALFLIHLSKYRANPPLERIFLSCLASNHEARRFYKEHGFKRCGVRRKSVKWQGQYFDEIEMVLELG